MPERLLQVRMEAWLHSALKAKCATFGMTMREVIVRLAERFVAECKAPGQLADGRRRARARHRQ